MNLDSKRQAVSTDQRILGFRVGALSGAVLRILTEIPLLYYASELGNKYGWLERDTAVAQDAGRHVSPVISIGTVLLVSGFIGLLAGGVGGVTCRPLIGALLGGVVSAVIRFRLLYALVAAAISLAPATRLAPFEAYPTVALMAVVFAGAIAGGFAAFVGRGRRCDLVT
jgi:hypothetical protein